MTGSVRAESAPVANNDQVQVTKDAETPFDVKKNDTDADGDPLAVVAATAPLNGKTILFNGGVRYKPNPGFVGNDQFTYTLRDGVRIGSVDRNPLVKTGGVTVYDSGLGSAMAPVPGGSGDFWLLTDRGPNVDGVAPPPSTLAAKVFPKPDFAPRLVRVHREADGHYSQVASVVLKRPDGITPITGLPNPNAPAGEVGLDLAGNVLTPDPYGLDTEGLVAMPDGSFWICDEYGPFIVKFDANGVEQERVSPFAANAQGHKLPAVLQRRRPNRGMEGLCMTPGGKLVGLMQNPLLNWTAGTPANGDNNRTAPSRIVVYDPSTGATQQFLYMITDPLTNQAQGRRLSEIACINETKFLVIERDDTFPPAAVYKKIYEIDLSGATDVSDPADSVTGKLYKSGTVTDTIEFLTNRKDTAAATAILANLLDPVTGNPSPVIPATKTEAFDLIASLGSGYPHDKIEGLVVLATSGSGAAQKATQIALVNDDDFAVGPPATLDNTVVQKFNTFGLPDYNEIAVVDLTKLSNPAATATVSVSVAPVTPYLVPAAPGVLTQTVFTAGDSINAKPDGVTPYRMAGIPDGLGAFENGDGTFTLTMNHELGNTAGVLRDHGSKGAFVSRWSIATGTRSVLAIGDLIQEVVQWNKATAQPFSATTAFSRLCSADLPAVTAFGNGAKGTEERLHMNGEETGDEGRAFAHVVTGPDAGRSFELPRVGRMSYENALASPYPQDKTVVMLSDDTSPGQLRMYVGQKQATGNTVEKAGLANGTLFVAKVPGYAAEDATATPFGPGSQAPGDYYSVPFAFYEMGDVSALTGAQQRALANANGATNFRRPEDGAWDPSQPNDFYFVTTDQMDGAKNSGGGNTPAAQVGRSRLWRMRFADVTHPELGGTLSMIIAGNEDPGPQMMDNITIDGVGRVLIQEDPGNQDHNAKIWAYDLDSKTLTLVAKHDPARFGDLVAGTVTAATAPFSRDEESSGIIDAAALFGPGWYLLVVQAHGTGSSVDAEIAERGQLVALFDPQGVKPPVFVSEPYATPNPAIVGEKIDFVCKVLYAKNGDVTWDFGDGSSATGPQTQHTYAADGEYVVKVTATNLSGSTVKTVTVTVGAKFDLAASINLNFKKAGKDAINFLAGIKLPAGFNPNGAELDLEIGGVLAEFTFNRLGLARNGKNDALLVQVGRSEWLLLVNLEGSFASKLADEGLTNTTVVNKPVVVPFLMNLDGHLFLRRESMRYTAVKNIGGLGL
ncbi:MAG: esterase-like activity of phytase family protein [Planctomycetota bacterium]|nr:esterase-like activity of phytase family protein [Planctomycetota bacterium]